MKIKMIDSDWLWYGVILTIFPLALVLGLYYISGHKVEELDYIPDLILVSFAVAVNLASVINSSKLKYENIGKIYTRLPMFSCLICLGVYYYLVGVAINLSEELLKLELLLEENPESFNKIAIEIKTFLNKNINESLWVFFLILSFIVILINTILGRIIEKKEEEINGEEYEKLVLEIRQLLRESKHTMSIEDYGKVITDTKKFLKSEKLVIGAKQIIDEEGEGMNPESYNNIKEKAKQIINRERGKSGDKK